MLYSKIQFVLDHYWIYLVYFVIYILFLSSAYFSPQNYWWLGFMSYSIPFWLIFNILLLSFYLLLRKKVAIYFLVLCILGLPFFRASLGLNLWESTHKNTFQVLSYNVQVFNTYPHLPSEISEDMITWLVQQPAEIKCLQEFYNVSQDSVYNSYEKLAKKVKYYAFTDEANDIDHEKGFFGLIILSKFPILKGGTIKMPSKPHQKSIFADILLPSQDTLRVINAHLHSLILDTKHLNSANTFRQIKIGFQKRAYQVDILQQFIQKSPYPVLLCADLNDLPYSYTYQKLKKNLSNAFEKAGSYFGFTYNHKRLFFLRIDQQFYSKPIKINTFRTLSDIKYSDHFPILGEYYMN